MEITKVLTLWMSLVLTFKKDPHKLPSYKNLSFVKTPENPKREKLVSTKLIVWNLSIKLLKYHQYYGKVLIISKKKTRSKQNLFWKKNPQNILALILTARLLNKKCTKGCKYLKFVAPKGAQLWTNEWYMCFFLLYFSKLFFSNSRK